MPDMSLKHTLVTYDPLPNSKCITDFKRTLQGSALYSVPQT